jgi:hypothetical protein
VAETGAAPGVGRQKRPKDADEGRLSRAVRTEQAEDLPRRDLEIDARKRVRLTEVLGTPSTRIADVEDWLRALLAIALDGVGRPDSVVRVLAELLLGATLTQ